MSPNQPTLPERAYQEFNVILRDVTESIGSTSEQEAYHALRGVLHTLRDRLTIDEAVQFAQPMPTLLRGIFFESYKSSGKPEVFRHKEDFTQRVQSQLNLTEGNLDAETATEAVLKVLYRHIDAGELNQVKGMMNAEIQELWPKAA